MSCVFHVPWIDEKNYKFAFWFRDVSFICRLSSTYLKRGPYPNERNFTWFIFLHRLNRNYNCFQQQKGFEKKLLNRDLINYPPRPHLQHLSSYVYLFAFFQKEVLKNIIIFINENKTHS